MPRKKPETKTVTPVTSSFPIPTVFHQLLPKRFPSPTLLKPLVCLNASEDSWCIGITLISETVNQGIKAILELRNSSDGGLLQHPLKYNLYMFSVDDFYVFLCQAFGMGQHGLSGWVLHHCHTWQDMPFLSASCCPVSPDGCCFSALITELRTRLHEVSGIQRAGVSLPCCVACWPAPQCQILHVYLFFFRAGGVPQPLPIMELNAFPPLLKQRKSKYK